MLQYTMFPAVIKLIKGKTKTIVFLNSSVFRCVTYDRVTQILNVTKHDDVIITSCWVSPQRFSALLSSLQKELYWAHKIVANKKYLTRIRDFKIEKRIDKIFSV